MGFASCFFRSSSQCHSTIINNNSQGEEEQRGQQWKEESSPKVRKPHAILRARKTTKEKHKSSKIDLGEGPLESGAEKAGWALV